MRKLAAIMFADMMGFTSLMQANEQLARQKRKHLKEVLETYIPQHQGEILQYYGDGSLSIFTSAVEAARAAIKIQQALRLEPKVDLRIGLHLGDVSIEGEAIFGDGVNLASRIESLSVPGGIFLSEKIYDELKNQEDIQCADMGYFELKNIKNPVHVFAIVSDGITTPSREAVKGKTKPPVNRLAVLPFVNMSADQENEYFSDGITEELLNTLTRVKGLQVTSRTSAFAFKGKNEDIREIAAKLNVDKVLEGSVRKMGSRVRITAQLINADDGYHIWSENYDRDLTDIFKVQDEISEIIANKLRKELSDNDTMDAVGKGGPVNMKAYNLFLKGLHFHNKLTPADAYKALAYFEQAIALAPDYAKALACSAAACAYLGVTGQMQTTEAFEKVHRFSQKAIAIDPQLADGYTALGSAYLLYDWKWEEAALTLQKAIDLNPAVTQSYELLAFYHAVTGNKKQAITLMESAVAADPLSPSANHYLADMYFVNEQYDESLRRIDHTLEIFPNQRITLTLKGWVMGMKGDWEKALEIFREVHRQVNHPLKGLTTLGFAYGMLGEREKAMDCIQKIQLREEEDTQAVMEADLALVWWGMGEKEKAIGCMYQCIEKRLGSIAFLLASPMFAGLKDDPRYSDLKNSLGLPG